MEAALDTPVARNLTVDVGGPLSVNGDDTLHVDGGDIFLFGGRAGHEWHD